MTIIPRALRLERFGSFRKRQTFEFPRAPGLYFMQGKNEVEPRLTANGTGKSTIWKALTWLMHGRTPEGLGASDICSWGEDKGTEVSLEFSDDEDGLPQFITRTWKPNSWKFLDLFGKTVDLAKDPQNEVLQALRISLEPWLCTVLMAQGQDYFLDMDRNRQAALFASVMDLDGWMTRADRASKAASEQDTKSRRLERDLAEARGRLDTLERHDGAGDAKKWREEQVKRLARLERDHDNLMARRKGLKDAAERAQALEDAARAGLAAVQPDRALEDELTEAERELRRMEDDRLQIRVRRDAVAGYCEELAKQDAACPHCKRPFDTKHWQQESEKAERNLRSLSAEHDQMSHKITLARNRRDVLDKRQRALEADREGARLKLQDAERARSIARNDLAILLKQLDGVEDMYDEVEKERNPFQDAVERAKREAERLRDDVYELNRELEDSDWVRSIKQGWVKWFKEIRLREIATALSELEIEVNSCVTALGLVDWELEFRVDRETKGGTVQRGFSVFVRAPGAGDRAVPWEAWSGGEKQRLRVAANMGLGNLVRARTGCDFPLEVWDEPTNGLSPEGQADLFTALADRARAENRVVFLVDHKAHDFGGFAGTCTVVKTPSGSRVRSSWSAPV